MRKYALFICILGVTAFLYAPIRSFLYSYYDDVHLIEERKSELTDPNNITSIFFDDPSSSSVFIQSFYRPMLMLSFVFDALRGPFIPTTFFVTNLWIHLINIVLFWMLVRTCQKPDAVATLVTAVFALSPLQSMAVAWIPGRNDSLLALFFLSATLAKKLNWHLFHYVFFFLALLTKETAVVFPAIWILLFKFKKSWLWLAPLVIWIALRSMAVGSSVSIETALYSLILRLPLVAAGMGYMIAPFTVPFYPIFRDIPIYIWFTGIIGLLTMIKLPRVISSFLLLLLPSLITAVSQPIGEPFLLHRLYLPLALILIGIASELHASYLRYVLSAYAVMLVIFLPKTINSYRDEVTIWSRAVKESPHSAAAWNNLGSIKLKAKDHSRAYEALQTAERLDTKTAFVHANLSLYYKSLQQSDQAITEAQKEVEYYPNAESWHLLGSVYQDAKMMEKAAEAYRTSLTYDNSLKKSWAGLLYATFKAGNIDEARKIYQEAKGHSIEFNPEAEQIFSSL